MKITPGKLLQHISYRTIAQCVAGFPIKKTLFRNSFIVLITGLLFSINLSAQTGNAKKLVGTWLTTRVELLKPMSDSLQFFEDNRELVITFAEGNRFTIKKMSDSLNKDAVSGIYKMSADEKTIIQDDTIANIIKLTDGELVVRVKDEFIFYYKRIKKRGSEL